MVAQEFQVCAHALQRMAETLHGEFSADALEGWFEALQDLSLGKVLKGIHKIEQEWPSGKFFPRPADLRAMVEPTRTESDMAEYAWLRFRWALQRVTVYQSIDFHDAALHATIVSLFGGWPQTAELLTARLGLVRADFLKAYTAHLRIQSPSFSHLSGLHEQANGAYPWAIKAPVAVPLAGDLPLLEAVTTNLPVLMPQEPRVVESAPLPLRDILPAIAYP